MKKAVSIARIILGIVLGIAGTAWQAAAQNKASGQAGGQEGYSIPVPAGRMCKGLRTGDFGVRERQPVGKTPLRQPAEKAPATHPLLKVHGNVLYDLNYRSNIDTPYAEKNVYQHMVQTYLDITYKDHYPFRVFLTTRFSNSSLFRNFTDLNLRYDANDFNNRVRRQVQNLIQQGLGMDSLQKLARELEEKERRYARLRNWVNDPVQGQRVIAERERKWLKELAEADKKQHSGDSVQPRLDGLGGFIPGNGLGAERPGSFFGQALGSLGAGNAGTGKTEEGKGGGNRPASLRRADSVGRRADSLRKRVDSLDKSIDSLVGAGQGIEARVDSARKKMDSLSKELAVLRKRYQDAKALQALRSGQAKKEIGETNSGEDLREKLKAMHISDSSLPKGYRTLYSVRSFGIGRTMLDYSELSAKNISMTGLQVEYNPSYYAAFAAGLVDYRFRDYTVQHGSQGQYIGLARYGWGRKEGNNVILTYYMGRRQLYNAETVTAQGADIPNYNLMGFTVEGRYHINRTNVLVAEVAKSSSPYYSLDSSRVHSVFGSALKMSDHSNEAYSLKLLSFIPYTQTQLSGTYRHFGANFQSFSLFTTGSEQNAWSVKLEQPLFRRALGITASIRTNDFINPDVATSYKSTTVFKSLQATLRLKKWPVLSVGYFPSSQVIKLSDNQFQENLFYTLTGSATYAYSARKVSMISTLMYTRFYNRVTDSNFVYFNTKNILLSQYFFLGKLSLQWQASAAMNTSYNLYVLEHKAEYALNKWLSLGAGIKYNQQTVYNIVQWGYSGDASVRVPKIGEFRLSADKGFIPGSNRQLVENRIGRLTYLKIF